MCDEFNALLYSDDFFGEKNIGFLVSETFYFNETHIV